MKSSSELQRNKLYEKKKFLDKKIDFYKILIPILISNSTNDEETTRFHSFCNWVK